MNATALFSIFIDIRPGDEFFAFSDNACACSNNMLNVTNFYIRNLMTGLRKSPSERTENELKVIETVNGSIPGINAALKEKYDIRVKNIVSCDKYEGEALKKKLSSVKCLQFEELTPEKWFPGYNLLDAVFKYTDDKDYRSHHSHVIQHSVQQRCDDWKGYFEGLKSYSSGTEGFTGKPKIPGYKKPGGRSAAVFDRLACSIKHGRLWFPRVTEKDSDGKEKCVRPSISLSGMPYVTKESFIEARIVPYYGLYQLQVITDDGLSEEDILPKEKDIISPDGTPAGVMTLDPSLTNSCFLHAVQYDRIHRR
jgi:putative transposase